MGIMNRVLHTVLRFIFLFAIAGLLCLHATAKTNSFIPKSDSAYNYTSDDPLVTAKLVECYPNPATAYINFKFDNSVVHISKLYIYNFTGRQMNVVNITGNVIKVLLDNYYRGLYMYQLRDTNGNVLESGKFQVRN